MEALLVSGAADVFKGNKTAQHVVTQKRWVFIVFAHKKC